LFRSLRNDSEERTFLLIRGGSLKSFLWRCFINAFLRISHVTSADHLFVFDLITLTELGEEFKSYIPHYTVFSHRDTYVDVDLTL
jgi:hypothetical protein